MSSLRAPSTLLLSVSSSCSSSSSKKERLGIISSLSIPRLPDVAVSISKIITRPPAQVIQGPSFGPDGLGATMPIIKKNESDMSKTGRERKEEEEQSAFAVSKETKQLYALLEAVIDRAEMHRNVGEQRNNWNTLMLTSINSITLSAAAMAGATSALGPLLALKLPAMILLSAATTMLVVMNKIPPSQLAEEQRNALRLFGQLRRRIETALALGDVVTSDMVDELLRSMLALDRAYPLPLLGAMIDKFPAKFEPANWRPNSRNKTKKTTKQRAVKDINGWDEKLESELREVVKVVRTKDAEDYNRLGNTVLRLHKALAVSGPALTGLAALASAFIGCSSSSGWAPVMAASCAALATVTSTLEHGGQVGMVFEMYRNAAGFFSQLEDSIESALAESHDAEMKENGELFEMKVAMKLGRSLSELRDLARKSTSLREEGTTAIDEFASKLF